MKNSPLYYGVSVCDALIKKYSAEQLPPVGTFFYHQGVALSGMQHIYFLTKEKKYFNYMQL